MGAFVAGLSKEFHSKERMRLLIGYNSDKHTCSNSKSKKSGTYIGDQYDRGNISTLFPITWLWKVVQSSREHWYLCYNNINMM